MIRRAIPKISVLKAEAARRMVGFEFTCLAKNEHVEVWRCKQPEDWHDHFDITVTQTGIAVTGDMTGMLFNVGARYGIPFLRHNDKGYVAEKLEEQSRLKEFDQPYFLEAVARYAAQRVENIVLDEEAHAPEGLELPDWVRESHDPSCTFDSVRAWLRTAAEDEEHFEPNQRSDLESLGWALDEADGIEHTQAAFTFLSESDALNATDYYDLRIERLAENLVQRLYMLDQAAQAICAQKAAAAAQEPAHA